MQEDQQGRTTDCTQPLGACAGWSEAVRAGDRDEEPRVGVSRWKEAAKDMAHTWSWEGNA